jgi:hypothetical protein
MSKQEGITSSSTLGSLLVEADLTGFEPRARVSQLRNENAAAQ